MKKASIGIDIIIIFLVTGVIVVGGLIASWF